MRSDECRPHLEVVNHLGKTRSLLRSHGWKPLDERRARLGEAETALSLRGSAHPFRRPRPGTIVHFDEPVP